MTCFIADNIFHGEDLYDAQDNIYKIYNTIELYIPTLEDAIDDYYNNPNEQNEKRLLAVAAIAANLRIQADEYCIDYLESKLFNNDTEPFESEKEDMELYLKNIQNLYNEMV